MDIVFIRKGRYISIGNLPMAYRFKHLLLEHGARLKSKIRAKNIELIEVDGISDKYFSFALYLYRNIESKVKKLDNLYNMIESNKEK